MEPKTKSFYFRSAGQLLLRLVFGGFMLFGHGMPKLMNLGKIAPNFPDPLGIGSNLALVGALVSEVVFSALVVAGFKTRWATLPLIFTMLIAAFVVHGGDAFFMNPRGASKEPALLFLAGYLSILLIGGGPISVDAFRKFKAKRETKKTEAGPKEVPTLAPEPAPTAPAAPEENPTEIETPAEESPAAEPETPAQETADSKPENAQEGSAAEPEVPKEKAPTEESSAAEEAPADQPAEAESSESAEPKSEPAPSEDKASDCAPEKTN